MASSIEEKIEEIFKKQLDDFKIKHFTKTESINTFIDDALKNSVSKSGGSGNNYPDLKVLIETSHMRRIPVMIEAKGTKGKLIKLTKNGEIELVTKWASDSKDGAKNPHKAGDDNYNTIQSYAVNGAVHYANAILDGKGYDEVIAIGVNGYEQSDGSVFTELEAYYVSEKNSRIPKKIDNYKDLSFLKKKNIDKLAEELDKLNLTEKEKEELAKKVEATLEEKIKAIHQSLYDDDRFKSHLTTNEKLFLFTGLIMSGLSTKGLAPIVLSDFKGNDDKEDNDSSVITKRITAFLKKKKCDDEKIHMISSLLTPVFEKETLWKPINGESPLKVLYKQVKEDIIPCLESNLHLDFTGKIFNSLNDWVSIENDHENDVVLTPRYITTFMARLARTNKDSFVWDKAMGSAGFLVAAMDIMIKDAQEKIKDKDELEDKITHIKEKQLLGIEILGNIYILAVLNMILMGDGSSNMINDDSFKYEGNFPATVFLLNPPYSAPGKGFNFVEKALKQMTKGYACILIQENAGSSQGEGYPKLILEKNTLVASIRMPYKLFSGKSTVQTAIYVFQVARPHEEDDIVTFIDFSNDGYERLSRKKSTQEINLKNVDHADERYAEVEAIVLGKKPKTSYYTEQNGLVVKDTISLNGDDWIFTQHQKVDNLPTERDFVKTVGDNLAWRISSILKGGYYDDGFLKLNSLSNNSLTKAEENALKHTPTMKQFKMGDLFEKVKSPYKGEGRKQDNVSRIRTQEYDLPLINCKDGDNGVMYYGRRDDFTVHENALSIIYNGPPTEGQTYYQDEIGLYTDAYIVVLKTGRIPNKEVGLYLATVINKSIHNLDSKKYSRGNKATWENKVENDFIALPVDKNEIIDWGYMEDYITAIEKKLFAGIQK